MHLFNEIYCPGIVQVFSSLVCWDDPTHKESLIKSRGLLGAASQAILRSFLGTDLQNVSMQLWLGVHHGQVCMLRGSVSLAVSE